MKVRALLIAIFFSAWSYGQSPSLTFRVTDENMEFGRNIPVGTVLIDMNALKQYVTLVPLPTATIKTILQCQKLKSDDSNIGSAHVKEINVNSSSHQIGDLYGGGIIVAVWNVNGAERGLIASLEDLKDADGFYTHNWAGDIYNVSPAIPDIADPTTPVPEYNNGKLTCDRVNDIAGAIYLCQQYVGTDMQGGWYLPSEWELWACYKAASIVSEILPSASFQLSPNYWSSTESTSNNAQVLSFSFGTFSQPSKATQPNLVRAVKRF